MLEEGDDGLVTGLDRGLKTLVGIVHAYLKSQLLLGVVGAFDLPAGQAAR